MASVVITDSDTLLASAREELERARVDVEQMPPGLTAEQVAERADATVLLVGVLPFPAPAIALLRRTGLIVRCGIGVDIIDVDAASSHGIRVANVPDYCVDEVADHTLALVLAAIRRIPHFASAWRSTGWAVQDFPAVRRVRGSVLGVVGLGRIGEQVALRARAFGMDVLACDPDAPSSRFASTGAARVDLDELLGSCDVLSLHCPLTPATRHLIDASALSRMRDGSVLVNTSRGGLVDLDALDEAVAAGRLAGVALDVLDGEPAPPLGHPLLQRPGVLVTPHVAWYSGDARRDLGVNAARTALAFLDGRLPASIVNADAVEARTA